METIKSINISDSLVYMNNPSNIIIVDSRNITSDIEILDNVHRGLGMKMYGYHYFISKLGDIYSGRPERAFACDVEILMQTMYTNLIAADISPFDIDPELIEVKDAKSIISAGKIFICIEGNTEFSDMSVSQRDSLVSLCRDIQSRYRNIRNIYSLGEYIPKYNNLGSFVDMNSIRSDVNSSSVPVFVDTPSGSISYTYGKRSLYYNADNLISGNDVKRMQLYLGIIGFKNTLMNGIFDVFTYQTVVDFQKMTGLEVDGIFNDDDFEKLNQMVIRLNSSDGIFNKYHRILKYRQVNVLNGEDVLEVQTKLSELHMNIVVNGNYDIQTRDCVMEFQLNNNLTVNGEVGPIVWKVLMNKSSVKFTRELVYNPLENMFGEDIKLIQSQIKKVARNFGISTYTLNGFYDELTFNNARKIQAMSNYPIDGIIDESMYDFIMSL